VGLSVRRWQQFRGKGAVREADGRTFDDIGAAADMEVGDAATQN